VSAADVRDELLRIAAEAPPNPFAFPRTYVVRNGRNDGRVDLDPPPDARDVLPSLAGVEVWTTPGLTVQAYPGDLVIVQFRDARQERPVVTGFAPLTGSHVHPKVSINAAALVLCGATDALAIGAEVTGRRVVCYGDKVAIAVSGATTTGPILQDPASAPNPISKVSG
jgi:hypothetical protein